MVDTTDRRVVEATHDPVPEVTPQIRATLREAFARWDLPPDTVDDALLVVEELVTNVVDHARTPFVLRVHLDGAVLHIAVQDANPSPVRVPAHDLTRWRGRGLLMVEGTAQRWGCDGDDHGKTVWADLSV